MFENPGQSHAHSLHTLNTFYEFDDFMESVGTLVDMGCGDGLDLEWWATRTTRDDNPQPLNIDCVGVDLHESMNMARKYRNVTYLRQDFRDPIRSGKKKFDLVWCHDAFQYVVDPFTTLSRWRDVTSVNGMLVLIVPQTTNIQFNRQEFEQPSGCYWHWTLVSLMHVLAVSGWNCRNGFFKKTANDPWLHAVVYRSDQEPMDPATTTWYDLAERNLLPESAVACINRHGYVKQKELILPWLDKSMTSFAKH
jgi:hypothetical protein